MAVPSVWCLARGREVAPLASSSRGSQTNPQTHSQNARDRRWSIVIDVVVVVLSLLVTFGIDKIMFWVAFHCQPSLFNTELI